LSAAMSSLEVSSVCHRSCGSPTPGGDRTQPRASGLNAHQLIIVGCPGTVYTVLPIVEEQNTETCAAPLVVWAGTASQAQVPQPSAPGRLRPQVADDDAGLRCAAGGVDIEAMAERLKESGATTYYWPIGHAPNALGRSEAVRVQGRPGRHRRLGVSRAPSESPLKCGSPSSEPF
jgi:hypothetical protein